MSGTGVVLLIAVIAIAIWWIELRIHPIRRCPSCGGTGEVQRFGAKQKQKQ